MPSGSEIARITAFFSRVIYGVRTTTATQFVGSDRIRLLVDSFADASFTNAQMSNAREIVARLDPCRFQVTMFCVGTPDARIAQRPATRLICLPARHQTGRILREFLTGAHDVVFYLKASPAAKWYMRLRSRVRPHDMTLGTIESQSDLHHEPTVSRAAIRLWAQTVLRCDHLVSNSSSVQGSLSREYGFDSEVIPTGVDCQFFCPASFRDSNSRVRVLFVGSLRPFKGPHVVLDAAARFPAADFILVGDGVLAAELKRRVARERLANVQILGALDAEGVRRQYRRADIFLFPSRWEGSPKVILEAAACALPVVAFNDYEPETVVDEKTGFLLSHPEQMFERLAALVRNPEQSRTMGLAGRKHAESFDWKLIVPRWQKLFERVLPGRRGRGHARAA